MKKPSKRAVRRGGGRSGRLKVVYLTFLCAIVLLAVPFTVRRFVSKSLDDELPDLRGSSRAARRTLDRRTDSEIAAENPLEPHTLEPLDNPPTVWAENESSVYPMQQDDESKILQTENFHWMVDCYTIRVTWTYGGSHVINAGFILGPTEKVLILLRDMKIEFERVSPNCLGQFGSEQATLNHVVKSGRLRISIPSHKLESNERGPVLSVFRTAAPYIMAGGRVLSTMGENPFKVVHGYSNRADLNKVVQKAFGGR